MAIRTGVTISPRYYEITIVWIENSFANKVKRTSEKYTTFDSDNKTSASKKGNIYYKDRKIIFLSYIHVLNIPSEM